METVEQLFKILGKRVSKLPVPQQEEIIEAVLGMLDLTEQMNKSSLQENEQQEWEPGFNLTKSVSSFVLSSSEGGVKQIKATGLSSSPSDIV